MHGISSHTFAWLHVLALFRIFLRRTVERRNDTAELRKEQPPKPTGYRHNV